jgi:hypothetical protein
MAQSQLSLDGIKDTVATINEQIKHISFEMISTKTTQEHFNQLRKMDHELDSLIAKVDTFPYQNTYRTELKVLIIKIQSIQELIDNIIMVFDEKTKNDKIIFDLTALLRLKEETIIKLCDEKKDSDAQYASFSDQLMATYNSHLEIHAALYEDSQKKDAEIVKLLAIINDSDVPFVKLEKQIVQNEFIKTENENMKWNICEMNKTIHSKSIEISEKNDEIHRLTEIKNAMNKKLRKKIETIEKLTEENKKLKTNPFAFK